MIARVARRSHPLGLTAVGRNHRDTADRILLADLGILDLGGLWIQAAGVVDQRDGPDTVAVDLPICDLRSVRAPAKTFAQRQFLFINPVEGTVNDVRRIRLRQPFDLMRAQIFNVDVVGPHVGDLVANR